MAMMWKVIFKVTQVEFRVEKNLFYLDQELKGNSDSEREWRQAIV